MIARYHQAFSAGKYGFRYTVQCNGVKSHQFTPMPTRVFCLVVIISVLDAPSDAIPHTLWRYLQNDLKEIMQ